ncbi:MAG: hypothetical protein ACR2HM_06075 [Acidimicrobiales bacterium]
MSAAPDERDDIEGRKAGTEDNPDEGTAMTGAGAQPSGSAMDHWATAMPNTDATKPETMPDTESEPLPGETENRPSV